MLKVAWPKKQAFVFTISTGRSGTKTMCGLGACLDNVASFHEAHPIMHGDIKQRFNQGDEKAAEEYFVRRKLPRIVWFSRGKSVYLESNHMFIKSFCKAAIKYLGPKMRVIILFRDPLKTALSMVGKNTIPGAGRGNHWYLDPAWPENLLQVGDLLTQLQYQHDLFPCLWYWYEIKCRAEVFCLRYPEIPVFRLTTDDLNSYDKVAACFNALGLPFDGQALRAHAGMKANSGKPASTEALGVQAEVIAAFESECQARLAAVLQKAA